MAEFDLGAARKALEEGNDTSQMDMFYLLLDACDEIEGLRARLAEVEISRNAWLAGQDRALEDLAVAEARATKYREALEKIKGLGLDESNISRFVAFYAIADGAEGGG